VILLARGRETALIENGKPVNGKKDYRVEGQKSMAFDVPAWVRMTRNGNPVLVKLRSVTNAVQPGQRPRPLPGFTLERFIFETLQYDPQTAGDREVAAWRPGSDAPMSERAGVIDLAIDSASSIEQLTNAYNMIKPAQDKGEITETEAQKLSAYAYRRKAEMQTAKADGAQGNGAAEPNGSDVERLRNRMFALLAEVHITERDDQLSFLSLALRRDIESRKSLTAADYAAAIKKLEEQKRENANGSKVVAGAS
jgi:hypothetical protein